MTGARPWAAVAALLLVALPAAADIVLPGSQHIGISDSLGAGFAPVDPVQCDKYRANPSTFHLSESATITSVTLHDAIGLEHDDLSVDLDGTPRSTLICVSCLLCTNLASCGNVTIDLSPDVPLDPGDRTIAIYDPSGSSANCDSGNDYSWSQLTLHSSGTTTSIMLNRRRHVGDSDDDDDDYDTTDLADPFYPDADEGDPITQSFTLGTALRLTDVKLYRARDLDVTTAVVKIDGTSIGAIPKTSTSSPLNPYEANPTTVSTSLLLAAGTHTVSIDAGNLGPGSIDDFSWDDIVLRFTSTAASGAPGFFNAVDVGDGVLLGQIETKVAGGAFTLDLYALTGMGTGQLTTHSGPATVELLNAADSSGVTDLYGCNANWSLVTSLGAVNFTGGFAQVSGTFPVAGLKEARIKVTDSGTGAAGCSLDSFAIRPATLEVVASQLDEDSPGTATTLANTATSGLPRHRAGAPFTITVTGKASGGATATSYDGTPDWTEALVAPATVAGNLTITTWNGASGGARSTDTAVYDEVGAVTLAFTDSTWANVDADDTDPANRQITGTASIGRFIPDHFLLNAGTLTPTCAAGANDFSYLGSTLQWATATTLTARTYDDPGTPAVEGTTTQNYAGSDLSKLPGTLGQPTYAVYDDPAIPGTPTLSIAGLSAPTIGTATLGVANVTLPALVFDRTLVGAFQAEIQITLPAFTDTDGVAPKTLVLGSATAGNGIAFSGTGSPKSQRFGRLYFEPRYGSDRLDMDVPLRAEYFDGVSFMHNADDACTSLSTADVAFAGLAGQTHSVSPVMGSNGLWTVTITAPNPTAQGPATLQIPAAGNLTYTHALMLDDVDTDGFDDDPQRTVYFGLHAQEERWIYQRDATAD